MGGYLRVQRFWNNMKNVNCQVVLAQVREKIRGVIARFENEGGGKDQGVKRGEWRKVEEQKTQEKTAAEFRYNGEGRRFLNKQVLK